MLIVYVDDFKMSGPETSTAKAWEKLRKGLVIEDPSPAGKFLGCNNNIIRHTVEEPFNCLSLVFEGVPLPLPRAAAPRGEAKAGLRVLGLDIPG